MHLYITIALAGGIFSRADPTQKRKWGKFKVPEGAVELTNNTSTL